MQISLYRGQSVRKRSKMSKTTAPAVERAAGKPWTVRDAAEFLGVHPRTIQRAIDANKVRPVRFGRKVMLPDAVVRKLATEGIR